MQTHGIQCHIGHLDYQIICISGYIQCIHFFTLFAMFKNIELIRSVVPSILGLVTMYKSSAILLPNIDLLSETVELDHNDCSASRLKMIFYIYLNFYKKNTSFVIKKI